MKAKKHRTPRIPLLACLLLLLPLLLLPTLSERNAAHEGEYTAVFGALDEEAQVTLLAGAISLLTDPQDGYAVRLTVGAILLNRLASPAYGDTLAAVVTPLLAASEEVLLPTSADEGAMRAARDALNGFCPIPQVISFGVGSPPEGKEVICFGGYWFSRDG